MHKKFRASTSQKITSLEEQNNLLSRYAGAQGMVLLENNGALPLAPCKIALFGTGARKTVKCGTGSGDVNQRSFSSVENGLENAGFTICTKSWLDKCDAAFTKQETTWKQTVEQRAEKENIALVTAYLTTPHLWPEPPAVTFADLPKDADTAVYVIARRSGEGADRAPVKGDYFLYDAERQSLELLAKHYTKVIVVLNVGGVVDTSFYREIKGLSALLLMSQPGQCAGDCLADILTAKVTPCGKLTDTWAAALMDYPCVKDFLSDEASGATVVYREGIYVGYRYFDAFGIKAQYPFGYGLSYTSFAYSDYQLALQAETVHVYLTVQNIGTKFSGREIVQIYTQQPQKNVPKAKKILTGFAKTKVLAPQEKQQLCITFPLEYLASYSELQAAFILDDGTYTILAGSCSEQLQTVGVLVLDAPCLTHQLKNVFSSHKKMDLVSPNPETPNIPCASNTIYINHENIACRKISYQPNADAPQTCLQSLTDKQLVSLVKGFSCNEMTGVVGAGVEIVPGAAGETTNLIEGLPSLVMADGPCGIRIVQHFQVDAQGQILKNTAMAALENGLFDAQNDCATAEKDYYQYCTSFPIGTLLAQTWDEALLTEIGMAVSAEMVRYGIALWLAPGMNIHRNPLCGRNFEYYSEDPLLSGKIAAAQVCGVQKNTHTGAVIKHFACNNQETGRLGGNSVVSEQALREIYLKGFEIVVKEQKPAAIMTSYNAINGVHTANSYALCTDVLRNEWSFEGIVMTDWGTTELGADTVACILAGNDLIMPGSLNDESLLMQALLNGSLPRKALLRCAQRVRNCIRSFL